VPRVLRSVTRHGLFALVVALCVVAGLGRVATAQAANGDLEICSVSDTPSFVGRSFTFRVDGGPALSGSTSALHGDPTTWTCLPVGSFVQGTDVTVHEDVPAETDLLYIDTDPIAAFGDYYSVPDANLQVHIGADTTRVIFDNEPPSVLEICAVSQTASFVGRPFAFHVNGGSALSAPGNAQSADPATWSCVTAGKFEAFTFASVHEDVPADAYLNFIDTQPLAALGDFSIADANVKVHITPGTTRVLFADEPLAPGNLEICALSETPSYIGRSFAFHVNGGAPVSAAGNDVHADPASWSCTAAGTYLEGTVVNVHEDVPSDALLAYIDTNPFAALGDFYVPDANVAVHMVAGRTRVLFDNEAPRSLEICAVSSTPAFWGRSFTFHVQGGPALTAAANDLAADPATWSCTPAGGFLKGSILNVTEDIPADAPLTFIDTNPFAALGDFSIAEGRVKVHIDATTTRVLFANDSGDTDHDGIQDVIDTSPASASASFNDGHGTTGSITSTGGLAVTVRDAPSASDGVEVSARPGSGQATLSVCGFTSVVNAGSIVTFTCGSVTLSVASGSAKIVLGGGVTTVAVAAGGSATVSAAAGGYTVRNNGPIAVTITTGGVQSTVPAGASPVTLHTWSFLGFAAPIDAVPTVNVVKAGRTVPLKWRLLDAGGTPVTNLSAVTVAVEPRACSASAATDAVEETSTASTSLANLGDGYYQYNWKTPTAYASTCKTLHLSLGDGVTHDAYFEFKK
jgi:hypothetical protein